MGLSRKLYLFPRPPTMQSVPDRARNHLEQMPFYPFKGLQMWPTGQVGLGPPSAFSLEGAARLMRINNPVTAHIMGAFTMAPLQWGYTVIMCSQEALCGTMPKVMLCFRNL